MGLGIRFGKVEKKLTIRIETAETVIPGLLLPIIGQVQTTLDPAIPTK